jgi:xanthine/uracil permease
MNNIVLVLKKHLLRIIGIVLGLTGGYLYYRLIGCNGGTCPITSNPWISTLYGGLIGFLFIDLFKKKKKDV